MIKTQGVHEHLTEIRDAYQEWLQAVVDLHHENGEHLKAEQTGQRSGGVLAIMGDVLDDLSDPPTPEQMYVVGGIVGMMAYASSSEMVDAKGTFKPRPYVPIPTINRVSRAVIHLRDAVEGFRLI